MRGTEDRLVRARTLVEYLCSWPCAGRAPGSEEGARARARIREEFEAVGLVPVLPDGFLQPVPGCGGANVLGRIPGRGKHAERVILAAAHYDHLGAFSTEEVYWGADDNAAAIAILIDAARKLAERRELLDREIWFAAFDSEEPPHFLSASMGSVHFVNTGILPRERLDMMVCMDLMGHALGTPELPDDVRRSIFVLGAERSQGTGALVERAALDEGTIVVRRIAADVIPALSDYYAFERAHVPFLFLTCGRWAHYHTPDDTPEKLDYPKIVASADYLAALLLSLSERPEAPVAYQRDVRDDDATLASIEAVAEKLIPYRTGAKKLHAAARKMRMKLAKKNKHANIIERSWLTMMVLEMEALLR